MEVTTVEAPQETGPSVREAFGESEVAGLKKRLASFLTDDEYAQWRTGLAGALASVPWPHAIEAVADLVDVFLDTPFAPPLKQVYAESDILDRYLDPQAYDPEEVVVVELAQHTIETSRSPRLDVTVNGAPVGALVLDIKIVLDVKGLVLTVQDARIKKVSPGACEGSATVSFYGKVLAKQDDIAFTLPALDLGEGIPIAR